jgi:D-alanyl-D-alanine carboxypeptidase/D-alanyl-D-alanine-endopeptidase (penicillin-binding protein 4)
LPVNGSLQPILAPERAARSRSLRAILALGGLIFALAALVGLAAQAPRAAAASVPELQAELSHEVGLGGPGSSAYVYDLSAQQPLFAARSSVMRAPASVEKLYIAATALERLGASARLSTSVLGVGRLGPGGVWEGRLYLRGGGDPTFGSQGFIRSHYGGIGASVTALALALVRSRGIHAVTGAIEGDESYLNGARGEPASGFAFDPFLEGTLSGLAFDRGSSGSDRGPHAPAVYAARQLWRALKRAGVKLGGGVGAAVSPPAARALAAVSSPTLAQLLGLMLPPSDNFFAETLIKDLGARFAHSGSTGAGAAVVRETVASLFGIHPVIVDGSGLSRADQTSAEQIVSLLVALAPTALGTVLRSDMAVAGRTGTLVHRMRATAAQGRCQAKTGTLLGVSNLAGYCTSAQGHLLAFASLNDGISTEFAHELQDRVAISLASY